MGHFYLSKNDQCPGEPRAPAPAGRGVGLAAAPGALGAGGAGSPPVLGAARARAVPRLMSCLRTLGAWLTVFFFLLMLLLRLIVQLLTEPLEVVSLACRGRPNGTKPLAAFLEL